MSSKNAAKTRPPTFTQDIHLACQKHAATPPRIDEGHSPTYPKLKKKKRTPAIHTTTSNSTTRNKPRTCKHQNASPSAPRGTDHANPALSQSTLPYTTKLMNNSDAPSHIQNTQTQSSRNQKAGEAHFSSCLSFIVLKSSL